MIKKITLCFLLISIFSVCGCFLKEKSVLLQYNYKQGDALTYKVTAISKGTMTISNLPTAGTNSIPPIKMETNTRCIFTQKVIGIEEGGVFNLEISYDSFSQDIKIGEKEMSPSIFGKEEAPSIQGKKFNIKLTKDGSILEVTGIEEIFNQMAEVPSEDISKLKEDVEEMVRGDYCRFPIEEMKVGDAWIREQNYKIPFLGMLHGKSTYTIEEFTQIKEVECVKIGIDVVMNIDENVIKDLKQSLNMPAFEGVKVNGNAQGRGKMIFAYQEGKIIDTELKMDMNMEISNEAEPTLPKMNMNFTTQSLVELQ